jgi:hypothetical protein
VKVAPILRYMARVTVLNAYGGSQQDRLAADGRLGTE